MLRVILEYVINNFREIFINTDSETCSLVSTKETRVLGDTVDSWGRGDPDPLSPPLPIVLRFRQVPRPTYKYGPICHIYMLISNRLISFIVNLCIFYLKNIKIVQKYINIFQKINNKIMKYVSKRNLTFPL